MGMWSNKPKAEKARKGDEASEPTTGGQGSSWTSGRQTGAKLATVLLLGAIVCGPAALWVAFNTSSKPAAIASDTSEQAGLTADQQAAGSYALGYVGAWLAATRDNPGELTNYIDLAAVSDISELAWEYRDLAVVSIVPAEGDVVTVLIAANVKEQGVTEDGDATTEIWPRRYFQVAVRFENGAAQVIGMPAPVAGPSAAGPATLVYSLTLGSNEPAAEAALAFLGAYLAESGDITRYITPGTALTAISPTPYVQITPTDIRVDQEPSAAPADGETVKVLATVTLANGFDQQLSATYALTLTARANRWEVSALDLAPQEAASTETGNVTPTPTPTGAGTTEGK